MEYLKAIVALTIVIFSFTVVVLLTSEEHALYVVGCVLGMLEVTAIVIVDFIIYPPINEEHNHVPNI